MEEEKKEQVNNEIDASQAVDESILAQQPLMAALMNEAPVQPGKVEEPVNPMLASQPAVEAAPVFSEASTTSEVHEEEQPQDLSAYQPPSMNPEPSNEAKEEPKPEKKKMNIVKPIISILVVVALVVGGYFGYKKVFSGLNPFVKPIDNVADALEYFEKELGIKLEQDSSYSDSSGVMTYLSKSDDDSKRAYITGEKDGQLRGVGYNSKSNDLNETLKVMMPFMKNYQDSNLANVGIKLARKYGQFDYNGGSEFSIIKVDDNYAVTIEYKKDQETKKEIELVNENKAIITKNISIMEIALKKKYGKVDFEDFGVTGSNIMLGKGSILENKSFVALSFSVSTGRLSSINSVEEDKIIKSENANIGGKNGYLMVTKESMQDMEFTHWEFYIPSDGTEADIDNSEEKGYYRIGVIFSKDYLSDAEQEAVLKDAIKSVKLG